MEDVHSPVAVAVPVPVALADKVIVPAPVLKEEIVVPVVMVTVLVDPATKATFCPLATLRKEETPVIVALPAAILPVKDASARVKRVMSAYDTPDMVEIAESTYCKGKFSAKVTLSKLNIVFKIAYTSFETFTCLYCGDTCSVKEILIGT